MMMRPALALDPRHFGRRLVAREVAEPEGSTMTDELRLFATTFAGGFLFVSILLA